MLKFSAYYKNAKFTGVTIGLVRQIRVRKIWNKET